MYCDFRSDIYPISSLKVSVSFSILFHESIHQLPGSYKAPKRYNRTILKVLILTTKKLRNLFLTFSHFSINEVFFLQTLQCTVHVPL